MAGLRRLRILPHARLAWRRRRRDAERRYAERRDAEERRAGAPREEKPRGAARLAAGTRAAPHLIIVIVDNIIAIAVLELLIITYPIIIISIIITITSIITSICSITFGEGHRATATTLAANAIPHPAETPLGPNSMLLCIM